MDQTVAIIGGTGPLGRGVAMRLVQAGTRVLIGSRDADRARGIAQELLDELGEGVDPSLVGSGVNAEVVEATDLVIVAVPYEGLDATLDHLSGPLAGRIVVSAVNPLTFDGQGPVPIPVEEGSAAERIAARCPDSRVVAALQSVSSRELARLDVPLDDDVPVLGDDEDAVATVVALLDTIAGCRPIPAGPLRLSRPVEEMTCVLLSVNRRHKAHTGLRFSRL